MSKKESISITLRLFRIESDDGGTSVAIVMRTMKRRKL
jgi:hypothetical protein